MQRRTWLKLGTASAAILVVGGGVAVLAEPGLVDGRLAAVGRLVFGSVGRAALDGSLPTEGAARQAALDGLLYRIDALVSALPPHAQSELSQLLSLLASTPGRRGLAGLSPRWDDASIAQLQAALQSMRISKLSLRQQAYHALHDIVGGAYFSDASTWGQLGYPGPLKI